MYMVALISSISAFVCSFVPIFGIGFVLLFAITSIVLSILMIKKSKKENENNINAKDKKDTIVISLVLSIISIIICIAVNLITLKYTLEYIKNYQENVTSYYTEKFYDYDEYDLKDKVIKTDRYEITINNIATDRNDYYVSITIKSLVDDGHFSIYDFGIYDAQRDDFWFARTNYLTEEVSGELKAEQTKKLDLRINTESTEDAEKYFIFIDEENGFKIKI